MKFKYLIIDEDGDVTGTDNEVVAREYVEAEACTVIDTAAMAVVWEDSLRPITEQTLYKLN